MEHYFKITAQHRNNEEPAELLVDLTRVQALEFVKRDDGHTSLIEGILGIQVQQIAMHHYRSTDDRYIIRIERDQNATESN